MPLLLHPIRLHKRALRRTCLPTSLLLAVLDHCTESNRAHPKLLDLELGNGRSEPWMGNAILLRPGATLQAAWGWACQGGRDTMKAECPSKGRPSINEQSNAWAVNPHQGCKP